MVRGSRIKGIRGLNERKTGGVMGMTAPVGGLRGVWVQMGWMLSREKQVVLWLVDWNLQMAGWRISVWRWVSVWRRVRVGRRSGF